MFKEFRNFLLQTNALALAVGVVIGGAVGKVVSSLVADILMPIISLAIPGGSWRETKIVLSTTTDAAGKQVVNALTVGSFLGSIIDFVIVAAAVFLITKALMKPAQSAPTKTCPECLETIPLPAKRCRACSSPV